MYNLQRIKKLKPDDTTYYHYGLNGQLLVEIQTNGITREYLPLNNQVIAFVDTTPGTSPTTPSTNTIHTRYVHNNHLGAPSKITDSSGNELWAIYYHPFGWQSLYSDRDRDRQLIRYNLHFPGQYHDWESGLHYNWHRYYRSSLGRYITSDPIGLSGGINTYTYVSNNPIKLIDPKGLIEWEGTGTIVTGAFFVGAGGGFFSLTSDCVDGKQGKVKVLAVGPGVGFGGKGSITISDITFEDGKTDIDPSGFNGGFLIFTIGAARGLGISFSAIELGDAHSVGLSIDAGVTLGVFEGGGSSTVISSEITEDCKCE